MQKSRYLTVKESSTGQGRASRQFFDFVLLGLTYTLMLIGLVFIAVATYNPNISLDAPLIGKIINSNSGSWQAVFIIASPVAIWFICAIPYEKFKSFSNLIYWGVVVMVAFTFATNSIRNVSGWYQIGSGRMLQPAEFAKIAIILKLAEDLAKRDKPMTTFRDTVHIFMRVGIPAGITVLQGETGSVIVMAVIFYTMIYFAGADWKWLVGLALAGTAAVLGLYFYGKLSGSESYKLMRLFSFIDPKLYARSAGLQILNSQEAIGSGGLTGIGLFIVGSHSQLDFVPEDWTDFIFATVGEAVGFVGCITIIVLFMLLIFRMLYLARYTVDRYGKLIIIGVMAMMFFHVFQNTAMTVGMMPITGIPLPFISYGGSNLLTNIIGISLVLNVVKNRNTATQSSDYQMRILDEKAFKKRVRTSRKRTAYYLQRVLNRKKRPHRDEE